MKRQITRKIKAKQSKNGQPKTLKTLQDVIRETRNHDSEKTGDIVTEYPADGNFGY